MHKFLHIDFETRSTLDLKAVGLHNYARGRHTAVWCMGYAFDEFGPQIWTPAAEPVSLERLLRHVETGGTVVAHNAAFEWEIWNQIMAPRYGWPRLRIEQLVCTMAMAYAMSLPGALEHAAATVGLAQQKDVAGHRLMLQMAEPRAVVSGLLAWWDDPERLARLYEYCKQDVRAEQALHARLVRLSAREREVYALDHKINQRGVFVDRRAAQAAVEMVGHEAQKLDAEVNRITGGAVGSAREVAGLKRWIASRGVKLDGLAKTDVLELLTDPRLPDDVRAVLRLRQESAKTSTAKLKPMLEASSDDGRLRGMFQYHGAGTGRWAGRRVQLQNLPRQKLKQKEIDAMLEILARSGMSAAEKADLINTIYVPPLTSVSEMLRGFLCAPPGSVLTAGDFANIEGRALAWEAGDEKKLDAFRAQDAGTGPDVYLVAAGKVYKRDPFSFTEDSPERQIGKVCELALGYGGGVGAFQKMAKAYGVYVSDERAESIKQAWREGHPLEVGYWYALERAAIDAVLNPGAVFAAGPKGRQIKYRVAGSFLWCCLPSGRVLCYPYPKILPVDTPWGARKDALTFKAWLDSTQLKTARIVEDPTNGGCWWRISTYGGSLSENVTQAVSRDVLADAMLRADERGLDIVMHVHDEIVIESKEEHAAIDHELLKRCMMQTADWAAGLPIAVKLWQGSRYRK